MVNVIMCIGVGLVALALVTLAGKRLRGRRRLRAWKRQVGKTGQRHHVFRGAVAGPRARRTGEGDSVVGKERRARWARRLNAVALAAVFLAAWGAGMALGALFAGAIIGIEVVRFRQAKWERQRAITLASQWAQCSSMMASELSAGATPEAALEHVGQEMSGEVGAEVQHMANSMRWSGVPSAVSGGGMAIARAMRVSQWWGVALSAVMDAAAAELVARLHHRQRTEASLAGPRASTYVLMFLPLAGIGMGEAMGSGSISFLFTTELGGLLLAGGALLTTAGMEWSRALTAKAVAL